MRITKEQLIDSLRTFSKIEVSKENQPFSEVEPKCFDILMTDLGVENKELARAIGNKDASGVRKWRKGTFPTITMQKAIAVMEYLSERFGEIEYSPDILKEQINAVGRKPATPLDYICLMYFAKDLTGIHNVRMVIADAEDNALYELLSLVWALDGDDRRNVGRTAARIIETECLEQGEPDAPEAELARVYRELAANVAMIPDKRVQAGRVLELLAQTAQRNKRSFIACLNAVRDQHQTIVEQRQRIYELEDELEDKTKEYKREHRRANDKENKTKDLQIQVDRARSAIERGDVEKATRILKQ